VRAGSAAPTGGLPCRSVPAPLVDRRRRTAAVAALRRAGRFSQQWPPRPGIALTVEAYCCGAIALATFRNMSRVRSLSQRTSACGQTHACWLRRTGSRIVLTFADFDHRLTELPSSMVAAQYSAPAVPSASRVSLSGCDTDYRGAGAARSV
jgi:hypothetical protein